MSSTTVTHKSSVAVDDINQRTYSRSDVLDHYGASEGYVDVGERIAFDSIGPKQANGTLIDIGVGGGRTVPLLLPHAEHYVGIDYVAGNIAIAAARYPSADLRTLDARDLPWDDGSVDVAVFSYNGIDSVGLDVRVDILREVHRVLRPGGRFVFSCLNLDGPSARVRIELPLRKHDGPIAFAKDVVRLPLWALRCLRRGLPVYRRARSLRPELPAGFAVVQPPVHDYGLLLIFSRVSAMADQLRDIGFELHQVHGEDGTIVDPANPPRGSRWCYFLASKP